MIDSERMFVIPISYSHRVQEKDFLKDLLNKFDKDTLIGCNIFINNNIYNLFSVLVLNFEKDASLFEAWLLKSYPNKAKDMRLTFEDYFAHLTNKGFNTFSLTDADSVDLFFTEEGNFMFIFPDKKLMDDKFPPIESHLAKPTIFLSHSSLDKFIVDEIFEFLHSKNIRAWYDKYEIDYGDSISDKINNGLENSKVGLILLSKNFINSKTGWTKSEMNYFFNKQMREKRKNFIVINLDLEHDELPPLLQDLRYLPYSSNNFFQDLYHLLKKIVF